MESTSSIVLPSCSAEDSTLKNSQSLLNFSLAKSRSNQTIEKVLNPRISFYMDKHLGYYLVKYITNIQKSQLQNMSSQIR